jgi:hypothetical protein
MTNFMDQIAAAAAVTDQTTVSTGFVREVAPAGFTTARFISYVETGKQPQRAFQGVEKPDAYEVRLAFELNGPKHVTEYEHEGVKKTRTNIIRITATISNNEKSNFFKLLQKMTYGRNDIKHMAQMLGEGFLVKVTHNKSKDGTKTYANLKSDVWNIDQPAVTDPISNETTILAVPAATQDMQCLLWNTPSTEQWASVFIDGEYTREVEGVQVTTSKNFIQDRAVAASNFMGSPLEALVMGGTVAELMAPVEDAPVAVAEVDPYAAAADLAAAPVEAVDPLVALGLV